MTKHEWQALARALGTSRTTREDEQWKRCVEEVERECQAYARTFSRSVFRMLAGLPKEEW